MLIKIPSRFIQQSDIDKVKEVYINTESIVSIDLTKQVCPKRDKEKRCFIDGEFETIYTPNIQLANGCGVFLKLDMSEVEFNDLVQFINEKIYLSKVKDK